MISINILIKNYRLNQNKFLIFFLIFISAFLIIARLTIGQLPVNWDTTFIIDGIYRTYIGQIPNKDFSNPFGPLIFYFGSIGMKILSPIESVIPRYLALDFGLILYSIFTLVFFLPLLNRKKLGHIHLIYLFLISYIISPKSMGYDFSSYISVYNKYGYVLISTITIYVLDLYQKNTSKKIFLYSYLIGIILSVAFLTKITFLISGLLIILFGYISLKIRLNLKRIFIGALTFLLFFGFIYDFSYIYYLRDLSIVFLSRASEIKILDWLLEYYITNNILQNLYLFIMSVILFFKKRSLSYVGGFFLFLEIFISAQMGQKPDLLFPSLFSIIIIGNLKLFNNFYEKIIILILSLFLVLQSLLIHLNYINKSFNNLFFIEKSEKLITDHIENKSIKNLLINNNELNIIAVGDNNIFNFNHKKEHVFNKLLYWHYGVTFSNKTINLFKIFKDINIFENIDIIYLDYSKGHSKTSKYFLLNYSEYINEYYYLFETNSSFDIYLKRNIF